MNEIEAILKNNDNESEEKTVDSLYKNIATAPFKIVAYNDEKVIFMEDCAILAFDDEFHLMLKSSDRLYSWYGRSANKLLAAFRLRNIWKNLRNFLKEPETSLNILGEYKGAKYDSN